MKDEVGLKLVKGGHYSLDAKGYTCPYPEIFTRRALEKLKPGDVFELIVDNLPSCETVPAAARELGHKVLEVTKIDETTWKIVIQRQ